MARQPKIEQWKVDYIKENHLTPVKQLSTHLGITGKTIYRYLVRLKVNKTYLKGKRQRFPAQYSNSLNINQYFEP